MSPKNKKYIYKKIQPIVTESIEKEKEIIEEKEQTSITKIYKTTARLNLRAGAGMDKPILTVIPKGDEIIYSGYSVGNWYYVKYKEYNGFCLQDWLQ